MNLGLTPDFLAFQLKFNSHSYMYHTIYIFCLKRVPYKSKAKKNQKNKQTNETNQNRNETVLCHDHIQTLS